MSFKKEYFSTLEDISEKYIVNNSLSAEGIGTVTVLEEINGQSIERKLTDVLYVSGLRRNPFSISKITDKIFSFNVFQDRREVRDKSEKLTSAGVRYGNLYRMLFSVKGVYSCNAVGTKERKQLYLWNQRLGHVNINSVINTS